MKRLVFDSSFLMAVSERPTGWESEIVALLGGVEFIMLSCVRDELAAIASGTGWRSRSARVALQLAGGFSVEGSGGADVDAEVVSAGSAGAAVATVDGEMIATLKARRVAVVSLRGGRVALL